jgi:hypothetical protein
MINPKAMRTYESMYHPMAIRNIDEMKAKTNKNISWFLGINSLNN